MSKRKKDPVSAMEEIGFEWHEEGDFEKQEEDVAERENSNQKLLVDYIEGKEKLSDRILAVYFSVNFSAEM